MSRELIFLCTREPVEYELCAVKMLHYIVKVGGLGGKIPPVLKRPVLFPKHKYTAFRGLKDQQKDLSLPPLSLSLSMNSCQERISCYAILLC